MIVKAIKSVSSVQGNWYRVSGLDASDAIVEKVALWAVITLSDPENADYSEDRIVGLPADMIGVSGLEESDYFGKVAGYIELSEPELEKIKADLNRLGNYNLVWEE